MNSRFLVTDGNYLGSLAAIRRLGQQNISCFLLSPEKLSLCSTSRFCIKNMKGSESSSQIQLKKFMELPREFDNSVLYPSSDNSAWFFSSQKETLSKRFLLYLPSNDVIYELLNKKKLYNLCKKMSIPYPETFFPNKDNEIFELFPKINYPVLIKPKTQILLNIHKKGEILQDKKKLPIAYQEFRDHFFYEKELLDYDSDIEYPMIQRYYEEAMTSTISVSGFYSEDRKIFQTLFSKKVLQKPRNIGIGLCFESTKPIKELEIQVKKICDEVGYFGVFEVEYIFIESTNKFLLIDFNPRFYSQMSFDIFRNSFLPDLVYFSSIDDKGKLEDIYAEFKKVDNHQKYLYSSNWYLRVSLLALFIRKRIKLSELKSIFGLYSIKNSSYVDATFDKKDKFPYLMDIFLHLYGFIRHPRDFIRKFFIDI